MLIFPKELPEAMQATVAIAICLSDILVMAADFTKLDAFPGGVGVTVFSVIWGLD